ERQRQVCQVESEAIAVEPAPGVERAAEQDRQREGRVPPEIGGVGRRHGEFFEREGFNRDAFPAVWGAQQEAGQGEAKVGGLAAAAEVGPALIGGGSRPVVRVGSGGEAGDLTESPEEDDIPPGWAESEVPDEECPGPAPWDSKTRLDQELVG